MNPSTAPLAPPSVAAVLLAAGAASRMGYRPKCLMERDGEPLVRRQVRALFGAGVAAVWVVLGHHAERIQRALSGLPVQVVMNEAPDRGQVASLRLGLGCLPADTEAVLIALADQPLIDAQDIGELLQAYAARPAGTHFVRPVVDGQPGNPVVFSRGVARSILADGAETGGQQWAAAHASQVHRWQTPNTHYRVDVDNSDDVAALASSHGLVLRWPADLEGA